MSSKKELAEFAEPARLFWFQSPSTHVRKSMVLLQGSGFAHVPVFALFGYFLFLSIIVFIIPAIFLSDKVHKLSDGNKVFKVALYFLIYILSNVIVVGVIVLYDKF